MSEMSESSESNEDMIDDGGDGGDFDIVDPNMFGDDFIGSEIETEKEWGVARTPRHVTTLPSQ